MKLLNKFVTLSLTCLMLLACTGCNIKTYMVYTNIPQGQFELSDKNFKLGEAIGGYSAISEEAEKEDTSAYTTKQHGFYEMMANATLVISANFNEESAEDNYTAFVKAVSAELTAVDKALSATVTGSDIYNFNAAKAGATLEISQIAYEVLSIAKSVHALTDGAYNPALYYNVQAYGFGDSSKIPHTYEELPSDEVVEKYTSLASHFDEMQLNVEEDKYYVTKPAYTVEVDGETLSMKLDLGGIGKGYAVDRVERLFDEYGYKYGLFNFGASSMLLRRFLPNDKYPQDYFAIGFSSPRSPSREPYFTTSARNQKLSTSADDNQCYFIDGVRYCHIIDPSTGKPVQTGIMSVTVIGGSAAEDDALTTAIMAMGKERAIEFIQEKLTDRKVTFTCE